MSEKKPHADDLLCSVDFGTTKLKIGLVDADGCIVSTVSGPCPPSSLQEDLFDFDPADMVERFCTLVHEGFSTIERECVRGICISNQRATIIGLAADDTEQCCIGWWNSRCEENLPLLGRKISAGKFYSRTGLHFGHLYSIGKLFRLGLNHPNIFGSVKKFVFLQDYILRCLGVEDWVTDHSNASCSGLYDIRKRCWDVDLLSSVGIGTQRMSRIVESGSIVGRLSASMAARTGLTAGIPLIMGGGDQQCAGLGAGNHLPGRAVLNLGTAAVLNATSATVDIPIEAGYLTTAHVLEGFVNHEGFINSMASSLDWMTALTGPDETTGGPPDWYYGLDDLFYLPFIAGIGTPDFRGGARGAFIGLTTAHRSPDLHRAVMIGLGLEIRRVLSSAPEDDFQTVGGTLVLSGGCIRHRTLIEAIGGMIGCRIQLCREQETTLLGAAICGWSALLPDESMAMIAARVTNRNLEEVPLPFFDGESAERLFRRYCLWVDMLRRGFDQLSTL